MLNCVLKEHSAELSPAITALFRQSLDTGTLPQDWTNAIITPVYKKGSIHSAANYRPVSLTSVICKLLEHIICSYILTHMEKHDLLTPLQHGFRKRHSCESQLLLTVSDFFNAFDSKTQTDVGVLDFSRAFDTVPHERLLGKLAHYGIQGQTNKWIRNFLSGRRMQVVVDGETSSTAPSYHEYHRALCLVPYCSSSTLGQGNEILSSPSSGFEKLMRLFFIFHYSLFSFDLEYCIEFWLNLQNMAII